MKILVIGWYYSSNLGDAVLCRCVASKLQEHYPDAQVVVGDLAGRRDFSKDPPATVILRRHWLLHFRKNLTLLGWDCQQRHEYRVLDAQRSSLEQLAREDFDAVVFAGGQLFVDSLGVSCRFLTEQFARRHIPVFFNACGTGPSWSRRLQQELGQALRLENVGYVSCRDDVELVNRWCRGEVAVPASDPALWAADVFNTVKGSPSDTVGLGVMLASSLNPLRTFHFWQKLIRCLLREGIRFQLFTNGSEADMAFARAVLTRLPELAGREGDYLCPVPRTPEELVRQIAGFRSLISFRLHSHIIAASLDIPGIAIVWDEKLRFFFRQIGHPERCFTTADPPQALIAALRRAETEGYDQMLLARQREESTEALLRAMDKMLL